MKQLLKNLILFIPICLLFYCISICFFGDFVRVDFRNNLIYLFNAGGHLNSRIKEAEKIKNLDVLVLGSSLAYREFDPRIFKISGINMFTLGSSGQTPEQTLHMFKRFIKTMNPKFVIYVVQPIVFQLEGLESTLDIISNENLDRRTFMLTLNQNNIKAYNTFIYSYYRKTIKNDWKISENRIKDVDTYIDGGFVERKLEYFSNNSLPKSEKNKEILNNYHFFNETIKLLIKNKIDYYLIQPPITKKTYKNNISNNALFDNKMKLYGKYINFNNQIDLVDSIHFYDHYHLNQKGVEIFNKNLLDFFKTKKRD